MVTLQSQCRSVPLTWYGAEVVLVCVCARTREEDRLKKNEPTVEVEEAAETCKSRQANVGGWQAGVDTVPVWYEKRAFRRLVLIIVGVVLVGSFVNGVINKHNDFRNHYRLGVVFIERRPFSIGNSKEPFCAHYPPGRLMIDAAFAALPYRLSRGLWWAAGVVMLVWALRLWDAMAGQRHPAVRRATAFAAAAFSLGALLPWIVRDFDDCGQQVLLLFVLTLAGWAVWKHRPILAGGALALAATYKATPILFLPLLLYKRKWKEALWMVLAVAALNALLPMVWLGWTKAVARNRIFLAKSAEIVGIIQSDPSENGVEPPRHQNLNLKITCARYLQTYPPGHPLFIGDRVDPNLAHPLFVQFLDLSPQTAGRIIDALLGLLAFVLALRFGRAWGDRRPAADLAPEWAAVTGLCAILSPLCWSQHMVLFLPAAYLVLRADLGRLHARWRTVLIWTVAVLILAPQRDILGRGFSLIVHSYKPGTLAGLLILLLVLTIREDHHDANQHAGRMKSSTIS
jgi:hypothetical protein